MWRDPVAALDHAVDDGVVAAQRRVVTGQPGGHGQQLLQGDLAQPRIRIGREMVGQQLPDGLVQALELAIAEGDADQRRGEALGHRCAVVAVAGGNALPVPLVHQVAMADHQHAADLRVVVGDLGVQVVQDRRVHALLGRGGGPPAGRGPVVPLGRASRCLAGRGRLLAVGAGTGGRQHTPQAGNQQPRPAGTGRGGRTCWRPPVGTSTPSPVPRTNAAACLQHDATSPATTLVGPASAPTVRFTRARHKRQVRSRNGEGRWYAPCRPACHGVRAAGVVPLGAARVMAAGPRPGRRAAAHKRGVR